MRIAMLTLLTALVLGSTGPADARSIDRADRLSARSTTAPLTVSPARPAGKVVVAGRFRGPAPRPVVLQVDRGHGWQAVERDRSSRRGAFRFRFAASTAPSGTVAVRVLATKVRARGRLFPALRSRVEHVRTVAAPAPAAAPAPTGVEGEVLALVNKQRAAAGCPAVRLDERLQTAARRHSLDQASTGIMSHLGSLGSTLRDRVDAVGFAWRLIGENVAAGQSTAREVMDAWMASPAHRANILECRYTHLGVGLAHNPASRYDHYWTQVFAATR